MYVRSDRYIPEMKQKVERDETSCALIPPPHAPSINEPCESDKDAIIQPTTKLIWMLLSKREFSIHNKHIDTKKDG